MPRKVILEKPVIGDLEYSLGEFLKRELKLRKISYGSFARSFEKFGKKETEASIRNKLARGKFKAVFLLLSLQILKCDRIDRRLILEAGKNAADRGKEEHVRTYKYARIPNRKYGQKNSCISANRARGSEK